jgi:hypothetical protein
VWQSSMTPEFASGTNFPARARAEAGSTFFRRR